MYGDMLVDHLIIYSNQSAAIYDQIDQVCNLPRKIIHRRIPTTHHCLIRTCQRQLFHTLLRFFMDTQTNAFIQELLRKKILQNASISKTYLRYYLHCNFCHLRQFETQSFKLFTLSINAEYRKYVNSNSNIIDVIFDVPKFVRQIRHKINEKYVW